MNKKTNSRYHRVFLQVILQRVECAQYHQASYDEDREPLPELLQRTGVIKHHNNSSWQNQSAANVDKIEADLGSKNWTKIMFVGFLFFALDG